MAIDQFLDDRSTSSDGGPSMGIATAALIGVTALAVLHPHPLVLPVLSVALVLGGFVAAGVQYLRHRDNRAVLVSRMRVPGLVLFFGFAAAMLGDPDPAVQSLQKVR